MYHVCVILGFFLFHFILLFIFSGLITLNKPRGDYKKFINKKKTLTLTESLNVYNKSYYFGNKRDLYYMDNIKYKKEKKYELEVNKSIDLNVIQNLMGDVK